MEIEARMKIQTEGKLQMENLKKLTEQQMQVSPIRSKDVGENLRHTKIETGTSVK